MWPLNLATPAVLEVMNQFAPRYSVDSFVRWDIYMAYGAAKGDARALLSCFKNVFPTVICLVVYENMEVNENIWGFGRSRELRDNVEEDALQYIRGNPPASTWLRNTKPHRRIACSQGQPFPFSESAGSAPDRPPKYLSSYYIMRSVALHLTARCSSFLRSQYLVSAFAAYLPRQIFLPDPLQPRYRW